MNTNVNFTSDAVTEMRVDAGNAMSVEAYENYLEWCRDHEFIGDEEFRLFETLPLSQKRVIYAFDVLTCPFVASGAKQYARRLLQLDV